MEESIYYYINYRPILTVCQYCQCRIYSCVENESSWAGVFLSILFLLVFNIYGLFLIILLIPLTQTTIHTCPNCLNKIGVRSFYDTISLGDKIFTFQLLGLGIIITKKQILAVFIFLLTVLTVFIFLNSFNFEPQFLDAYWKDYQNDCITQNKYEDSCYKYLYKDVSWNGYALRVDFDSNFFSRFQTTILVKMNEKNDSKPDLTLKLTYDYYDKYKKDILNTTRGSLIHFNGTIIKTGNYPFIEVFNYKLGNTKIDLMPHIYKTGRYSEDLEKTQNQNNTKNLK